ncbi:phosphoribosyl-AMP cyclohydrolase [Faecalicoccus acidiformans]|uniref:phosphoribosyl-AMP cyclohydrolase n=1 Tax=Faecalicoccus acidiformans TaxID=915173 RepID=UPI00320B786A
MIKLDFLKQGGLIPCIVQEEETNEVLMLAYMNEESLEKTIETGLATYWSRSRNELWVKGETSGHVQLVSQILVDCDQDTLLIKVRQEGAACHTGKHSCFYRTIQGKEIL